jgi:alkanesulfonate monooxygenase SsuD/methylene tetrahydromethanopterin reductase-like flavin-dependent oxidoreductase (luciferase family)
MVSPTSFRHPSILAKLATTADHVSGGRIELGMGTGWSEVEHTAYGFPFLSMKERMDVLEEQLEIVHDGHWGPGPFSFAGRDYELRDLRARPLPVQRPHPPLIMGGNAGPRAARLAARFADEYNTVMPTLSQIAERRANIEAACAQAGREPIPFSVMTTCVVGADEAEYEARLREFKAWTGGEPNPDVTLVGTVSQVRERFDEYAAAGVSRVFLQHLLHRDIQMVELIGRELV